MFCQIIRIVRVVLMVLIPILISRRISRWFRIVIKLPVRGAMLRRGAIFFPGVFGENDETTLNQKLE